MPKTKPITKAKARALAKAKAQQQEKRKKMIFAGVVGLIAIVLLIFFLTRPENAVKSAEFFLSLLGQGKTTEAYQSTSRSFQERMNEEEFEVKIEEMGLHNFASVSWSAPEAAKEQTTLAGTITTKAGDKIPLQMLLLRSKRDWEVFSFGVGTPGIARDAPGTIEAPIAAVSQGTDQPPISITDSSVPVPGEEEMRSMVFDVLFNLQKAVGKKNFEAFHGYVSQQWQRETAPDALMKKYQFLIDKKFDRAVLIGIRPLFDDQNPYIGTDNSITLMGRYAVKPFGVGFELKYVRENSTWKVSAAEIKLTEDASAGVARLPGPAELNRLVASTLLKLNDAVASKNFTPFYQILAKQRQTLTSPEKLMADFKESIDKKIDIKGIADADPIFSEWPVLNMENQFSVSGIYEVKDLTVNFQFTFQFEDAAWKPLTWSLSVTMTRPAGEEAKSQ